jgi:hypothetical protein
MKVIIRTNLNIFLYAILGLIMSANLFAGTDLGQNARKLGSIVDNFGVVIVGVFLSISGLYVASGSQEGTRKFSLGLIGTIIFFCAGAIVTALKALK